MYLSQDSYSSSLFLKQSAQYIASFHLMTMLQKAPVFSLVQIQCSPCQDDVGMRPLEMHLNSH